MAENNREIPTTVRKKGNMTQACNAQLRCYSSAKVVDRYFEHERMQ